MEKVFLVKWCSGAMYNFYYEDIFATVDESEAILYVEKFNRILLKYKKFYSKFEEDGCCCERLRSDVADKYFDRWCLLRKISFCTYSEITLR